MSLRALAGAAPEEPESFLLWTCGIARHVICLEWRRRRRARNEQPPEDFIIDGLLDPTPRADRLFDERSSLTRAIGNDTEGLALLLRRYVDNNSSKELAKEVGLTTAALRMRVMGIRASARARSGHLGV